MAEAEILERFTRRRELAETGVFLLLILPSMAFSFFAVRQGNLSFPLVAAITMLRDVGLVALILLFLSHDRQSVTAIGWVPRHLVREVVLGVALFFPLLLGVQGLEALLRSVGLSGPAEPPPQLTPTLTLGNILLAVLLVAVVAVSEETIFRGYLILRFSRLLGSRFGAVLLSAVIFAIGHGYEGTAGVITVLLTGVVLAVVYVWRQSLVAPIVLHFLVNLNALVLVPALLR